jgi:hypothetical protein
MYLFSDACIDVVGVNIYLFIGTLLLLRIPSFYCGPVVAIIPFGLGARYFPVVVAVIPFELGAGYFPVFSWVGALGRVSCGHISGK